MRLPGLVRQTLVRPHPVLRDLTEHAVQPPFVSVHRWQPFDDAARVRGIRRTTVAGDGPTCPAMAA